MTKSQLPEKVNSRSSAQPNGLKRRSCLSPLEPRKAESRRKVVDKNHHRVNMDPSVPQSKHLAPPRRTGLTSKNWLDTSKRSFSNPELKRLKWTNSYKDLYRLSLVKVQKLADETFDLNTNKLCPHKYHCVHNALYKGLFRSFASAYTVKTTLSLGRFLIGKGLPSVQALEDIYFGSDALKFSQWIAVQSFSFKIILCSLRNTFKKNNPIFNAIAGFLSSLAIMLDISERRTQFALYCFVRAVYDAFQVLKLYNPFFGDIISFAITQIPIMFCYARRPKAIDRGYYKWINHMGNINGKNFRHLICESPPFKSCKGLVHPTSSCTRDYTMDWLTSGMLRAARMYIPVHFLPPLLFSPEKVVKQPLKFLRRKSQNMLRSSFFLTTYQYVMKMVMCHGRTTLGKDHDGIACVAGFFCGLSIAIEHPSRRKELFLYTLPRALEGIARLIPRTMLIGKAIRLKYLSLLLFQLSIAIWMYCVALKGWDSGFNSLNKNVLKVVFGTKH